MKELQEFLDANIFQDQTNQRVWFCSICQYAYQRRNNVERHVEANHVQISFSCEMCGKQMRTRHSLYYHMKKHNDISFVGNGIGQ